MRLISVVRIYAAMLMAYTTFVACSSDSNEMESLPVQPSQQYTMVVTANMGNETPTRGLSLDGTGLKTKWNENEKVYVCRFTDSKYVKIGELTAAASNNVKTTLTGTITISSPLNQDEKLTYFLHGINWSYGAQNGELTGEDGIESKHDFAMAESTGYTLNGNQITDKISLSNEQAIVKFTLTDGTNPISAKTLTISDISDSNVKLIQSEPHDGTAKTFGDVSNPVTVSTSGKSELYVALRFDNVSSKLTLTATTASNETYSCIKDGVSFAHGNYYAVTVKMTKSN